MDFLLIDLWTEPDHHVFHHSFDVLVIIDLWTEPDHHVFYHDTSYIWSSNSKLTHPILLILYGCHSGLLGSST
jgi:hypothetical protein